jgi:hypothetical protein
VTTRVAFLPAGRKHVPGFHDLGENPDGRWGLLDDKAWLAAEGDAEIELLYFSHPDYLHATRGLDGDQVAEAVLHRRRVFSANLPSRALGEVALAVSRTISMLPAGPKAGQIVSDLLTAHASFTTVARLAQTPPLVLLDYIRVGDAGIIAELESPTLREAGNWDPDGVERDTRRQFALDLGQITARHGQAGEDRVLPFVDVVRTYFVTPPDAKARSQARFLGDPVRDWRDGIILPIPERLAIDVKVRGRQMKVIFPALGPFLGVLQECTQAQQEIELSERLAAPGYPAYLNQRRLAQAVRRFAAHLIAGANPEIGPVLFAQAQTEASCLPDWFAHDVAGILTIADLPAEIDAIVDTASLLAMVCRRNDHAHVADRVEALGRALSQVGAETRS